MNCYTVLLRCVEIDLHKTGETHLKVAFLVPLSIFSLALLGCQRKLSTVYTKRVHSSWTVSFFSLFLDCFHYQETSAFIPNMQSFFRWQQGLYFSASLLYLERTGCTVVSYSMIPVYHHGYAHYCVCYLM